VQRFEWSPDGTRIALTASRPLDDEETKRRREQGDAYTLGSEHPRHQVWILAIAGGDARAVTDGRYHTEHLSWSRDSSKLALVTAPNAEADASVDSGIVILEPANGNITRVRDSQRAEAFAYSSSSEDVAYLRPFDGKGISRRDLFIRRSGASAAKNITETLDRDVDKFTWSRDGKSVYFILRKGAHSVFYRSDPAGERLEKLRESQGVVKDLQVDAQGKLYGIASSTVTGEEIWAVAPPGQPERLTNLNEELQTINLGKTEIVRWQSSDGLEVEGLLVTPPDLQASKRYPLIVDPHGGPRGHRDASFDPQSQFFAARGYAVLKPNFRGSTGYGDRFTRGNVGDWGTLPFSDVMAGVDVLVKRGLADPDNLFLYGWSYGGYMANWAITHSNRFRAVASGAGVADGVMQYVLSDARRWRFDYFVGSPFVGNEELYRRQSPVTYIRQAKTPTLFIHGERDVRVPPEQGIMMYRALKDQGVETEMVIYPREGHGLVELRHILDRPQRVVEWFDKYGKRSTTDH
jgi:dipeptidyl aminopeptidase/acylaminoacyl peptidase